MGAFTGTLPKDELLQTSSKNKFIKSLSDGQVTKEQFNEWLAQEYLVTVAYKSYLHYVHANASTIQRYVWNGILEACEAEVKWIADKLKERNINIDDIKPSQNTLNDMQFFNELMQTKKCYLSLLTAPYAIEFSSYDAWKSVTNPEYAEFVERWGCKEVGESVSSTQKFVDTIAKFSSENDQKEAREVWQSVINTEAKFSNI